MRAKNKKLKALLDELDRTQSWLSQESTVGIWKINQHILRGYPLKDKERAAIIVALNRALPPWASVDQEHVFSGVEV